MYRQTVSLDSGKYDAQIIDTSTDAYNGFPVEQVEWADSCLIIYSITDRKRYVEINLNFHFFFSNVIWHEEFIVFNNNNKFVFHDFFFVFVQF